MGCTTKSAPKNYILAEKFWENGNYAQAAKEFKSVYQKNPKSKLGLNALFRTAQTQTLFLDQQIEAIDNFKIYIDNVSDEAEIWKARKEIGEILFVKLQKYEESINYYNSLIKQNGTDEEQASFLYRIAKSYYHLWKFEDAISTYRKLIQLYPDSSFVEKASFQIGMTYFTGGNENFTFKNENAYQKAIESFKKFMDQYPQSIFVVDAQFGIASCFEEMDLLEDALKLYEDIEDIYPSPKVIKIKLVRIKDRMAKKGQ